MVFDANRFVFATEPGVNPSGGGGGGGAGGEGVVPLAVSVDVPEPSMFKSVVPPLVAGGVVPCVEVVLISPETTRGGGEVKTLEVWGEVRVGVEGTRGIVGIVDVFPATTDVPLEVVAVFGLEEPIEGIKEEEKDEDPDLPDPLRLIPELEARGAVKFWPRFPLKGLEKVSVVPERSFIGVTGAENPAFCDPSEFSGKTGAAV